MTKKATSTTYQKIRKKSPNSGSVAVMRTIFVLFLLCLTVFIIAGICISLKKIFLTGNKELTLSHFSISLQGARSKNGIERKLNKFIGKNTNLFDLDLGSVKKELEKDVFIERVRVSRILPTTLKIEVFERYPIAKFYMKGRKLIDREGYLLPGDFTKNQRELPLFAGIRNKEDITIGKKTKHPKILSSLLFLEFIATHQSGKFFEPIIIQLANKDTLRVRIKKQDKYYIRDNCLIILPIENLKTAILRAASIIRERAMAQQYTGYIDATYYTNIPVKTSSQ
ncbi:MAG: FtsQ-type POTRA domain-containing protein [Verrucomicrobiota bacterium]|nr:FtsQ-type POTRA domain-containing protein [Verrucomicrobiota bacterium]